MPSQTNVKVKKRHDGSFWIHVKTPTGKHLDINVTAVFFDQVAGKEDLSIRSLMEEWYAEQQQQSTKPHANGQERKGRQS